MNFNDIKLNVLENWKKFKKLESIDKKIANNQINNNFFIDLENEFKEKSLYLNINLSSTNIPKKLNDYIFNSNINDINYIVEKDMIHLAKLIEVNIENKMTDINEKTDLNNQIRNSVYNELIKTTKISTNDKLINAILNSY